MADLPTFTVTGQPLPDWDPFTADLLPYFATDNSVEQYREWTAEELGLPATPIVPLPPPVNVVPPVGPVGPVPPPANSPTILPEVIVTPVRTILTGITAILFPQPTGPARFDEAPTPLSFEPLPEVEVISTPLPYPLAPLDPTFVELPYVNPWIVPTYDPLPDSGPGSAPAPFDPVAVPDIVAQPSDLPNVGGRPAAEPAPYAPPYAPPTPLADPFADPFGNPFAEPQPLPDPVAVPGPTGNPNPTSPVPVAPLAPGTPFDPLPFSPGEPLNFAPPQVTLPTADPLADPFFTGFPQPNADLDPEEDPCDCKKKKEKKKKRKPRSVCYRGTYVERKNGTNKSRTEEVPCDGPLPKKSKAPGAAKKRKSRKAPTWQDTLNDVFNLKP